MHWAQPCCLHLLQDFAASLAISTVKAGRPTGAALSPTLAALAALAAGALAALAALALAALALAAGAPLLAAGALALAAGGALVVETIALAAGALALALLAVGALMASPEDWSNFATSAARALDMHTGGGLDWDWGGGAFGGGFGGGTGGETSTILAKGTAAPFASALVLSNFGEITVLAHWCLGHWVNWIRAMGSQIVNPLVDSSQN